MKFEILSPISHIEVIAVTHSIRELCRLRRLYGKGRWRKMKGRAVICLNNDATHQAELHWYEARGIGKREIKVKYLIG